MLCLRRTDGQWIHATCACGCGRTLRIKVYEFRGNSCKLGFDDRERHFIISRPDCEPQPDPREGPCPPRPSSPR